MLDDSQDNFSLEVTGASELMDEIIDAISECGEILVVLRSWAMAISRGEWVLRGR